MVHPVYETTDARIIRGSALPWGEATHDENNTTIQMKSCFQNCRRAVLNKASNVYSFELLRSHAEISLFLRSLMPFSLALHLLRTLHWVLFLLVKFPHTIIS